MREYRKQREDFVVWIPQLVGKSLKLGLIIQKFQT